MMERDRWERIEQLYHAALESEPKAREAFLDEACAGDEALRREVAGLLACDVPSDSFIQSPAIEIAARAMAAEPHVETSNKTMGSLVVGSQIGAYTLLEPLGRGGMGEVHLALDTRLGRKVALKLLLAEFTTNAERLRRFEQEARAASALNHPNIITIHEIGEVRIEAGDTHYIVTEYVEGETLRQRLANAPQGRLSSAEALDVAAQIAAALAAAHEAGITHRDIKPENVMVRPDGLVKVLDFGLAKLTQEPEIDKEAAPLVKVYTDPGTVIGTIRYMAPEQARGLEVDGRTDIFSLGVTLYEMLAGKAPFDGATTADVIAAILEREPPPLSQHSPEATAELQRIVTKALRKDRDQRYQGIKDLLVDLKGLKQDLEMAEAGLARTTSSAEYIVAQIKRHKLVAVLSLAALVVAAVAVFLYFNRAPVLTDKDTILVADFVNKTGDSVFDDTLKQALAIQLEQSPFLNIFPEERAHEALRFMGRSPEERVTRDLAREICRRQGLKAMLLGSIAKFDRNYAITLEAVNAQTGEVITRQQVEAEGKDQVLKALGGAATKLRQKLGESLASLQKFDAPIEQATTPSLEAYKAFSQGSEQRDQGRLTEAIPFYQRAVEVDPNFALAWANLALSYDLNAQEKLAIEAAQKAFVLRERVSERERFFITWRYHVDVTDEPDKEIETLELWKRAYPREVTPHATLADLYSSAGQLEQAIEEGREAIRLNPNFAPAYDSLATAFVRLNRFDEARDVCERALQLKLDAEGIHGTLYLIAFVQGDEATMKRQTDWMMGKPDHSLFLSQAEAIAFSGKLRQSRELFNQAVELELRHKRREFAGLYIALLAQKSAVYGKCQQAREDSARSAAFPRYLYAFWRAGIAHALCGDVREAQALADEMVRRYPKDLFVERFAPLLRAAIEIQRGNSDQALQILQAVSRYESVTYSFLSYLRGQAYLAQRKGAEAAAEFQKILDHRGWSPVSALYVPAHLWLARAAVIQGDLAKARKSYQDFFALWKDADPDLPILIEAKKEYEKLK